MQHRLREPVLQRRLYSRPPGSPSFPAVMSGRGGRGGGRGGWRGRGRGGPMVPVAKDEDGSIIDHQTLGPPPLFPEVELPPHPEPSFKQELMVNKRTELQLGMQKSPFFLEVPVAQKGDIESQVERHSDKQAAASAAAVRRKRKREPLTSIIRLLPEYLPEELYSAGDRKNARLAATYWARAKRDTDGLAKLDSLAALEAQGGDGAAGGDKAEGAEGEEALDEAQDTDEEEEMEDDDYYKGAHFDDDEGYDDDGGDDGGGDDGAIF